MTSKTWTPSESDIQWQERTVAMIKQGGAWLVPMTAESYRIDHEEKAATLTSLIGSVDPETSRRIKLTFEAMGWTVKDGTDEKQST